jgi:methylated-DNA-protein-cysteine methyltransferase-like protein
VRTVSEVVVDDWIASRRRRRRASRTSSSVGVGLSLGVRLIGATLHRHLAIIPVVRQASVVTSRLADAVTDVVASIPAGRVMTYGDIARFLGSGSPRQVGQVLARCESDLPWHRVVMADGSPPAHTAGEHLRRLRAEGTPIVGGRADLSQARFYPRGADA